MHRVRWGYKRVYEAFNYRLRTFAGGRWASRCRPTAIALLLTERCNARCVHCDIWRNRGREDSPTGDEWRAVLKQLRAWLGPVQVVLTGGEALLKPFTPELIAYASSIGLFVELLTHGYWVDQSRVEAAAAAGPWRVTISLDGIGETHSRIRGRDGFFERTTTTIRTLQRVRKERRLGFAILLKTVVMAHNLADVGRVARYAKEEGVEVFYQAIEQNYNQAEDPLWFERSENWPKDPEAAARAVRELIALKREGFPISNSYAQLEVMIPYFRDPGSLWTAVNAHAAHEERLLCSALTTLQLQANGDVTLCPYQGPVGNVRITPIREIWEHRPSWWDSGCCLERRSAESGVRHA